MNTLQRELDHYLPSLGFGNRMVAMDCFRNEGVCLTIKEAMMLSGLGYDGLSGYICVQDAQGKRRILAHPIIEALFEVYLGACLFETTGMRLSDAPTSEEIAELLKKFEVDPSILVSERGNFFGLPEPSRFVL